MSIKAVIFKKNGKARKGKGFSLEELKKVGLDFRKALKLGIPVDKRRSSAYDHNVKALKEYLREKSKEVNSKSEK